MRFHLNHHAQHPTPHTTTSHTTTTNPPVTVDCTDQFLFFPMLPYPRACLMTVPAGTMYLSRFLVEGRRPPETVLYVPRDVVLTDRSLPGRVSGYLRLENTAKFFPPPPFGIFFTPLPKPVFFCPGLVGVALSPPLWFL